jgi:hypothetical protein
MVSDILYEYLSLASFYEKRMWNSTYEKPQRIQPIQLTESLKKFNEIYAKIKNSEFYSILLTSVSVGFLSGIFSPDRDDF